MRKVYLAILFLICSEIKGQVPLFDKVTTYGIDQISFTTQDEYGMLWFVTKNGIKAFNGYESIARFDSIKKVSLIHFHNHKIFIGSEDGNLYIFNAENYKPISRNKICSKPLIDIVQHKQKIYVASYGAGLYSIENSVVKKIDEINSQQIYDLDFSKSSGLLVASDNGIDLISHTGKISSLKGLPDYIITSLCVGEDDYIYGSNYDSYIFQYDLQKNTSKTIYQQEHRQPIQKIFCSGKKIIVQNKQKIYTLDQGLSYDLFSTNDVKITNTFIDRENQLWVATSNGQLRKSNLKIIQFSKEFNFEIQSILKKDNMLYLGTDRGLKILSDYPRNTEIQNLLPKEHITVLKDINGEIYIGTLTNGLYKYKTSSKKITHLGKILDINDNTILDIEKISENKIEVSSLSGILEINENKNGSIGKSNKLQAYVYDIYKDKKGTVWYGKDRNGLSKDENGKITDIKNIIIDGNEYKLGSVFSIAEDDDGGLYFSCSENGVLKLKEGRWQKIILNYIPANAYTSIIKISQKELLFVSENKFELYQVKSGKVIPIKKNTEEETKISYLNNYTTDENKGEIYVVTKNLINKINGNLDLKIEYPKIRIDKIEMNLEDREIIDQALFAEGDNNIRVSFTGIWLTDPGNVQYKHRLQGYNEDWITTKDRTVSYAKLQPGKYTFEVMASETEIFSEESKTTYTFTINKSLHKSLWFRILVGLIVLSSLYYLFKRNQKLQLLKNELEKKKIETELINLKNQLDPHFLFNTLNTLIGLIEEDPKKGVIFTQHLTDFFRSLSNISNKEIIRLIEEIQIIRSYYEILRERFSDNLILKIDAKLLENNVDKFIPPLTLQMLIENAVKHNEVSRANPLLIEIYPEGENIIVSNKKNPKINKVKSLGIGNNNIKERYKLLGKSAPEIIQTDHYYKIILPLIKHS